MARTVTIDIRGGKGLERALNGIISRLGKGGVVKVGFLEGVHYPIDASKKNAKVLSVAQVAFWNEFGTSRAPARPFFRRMVAEKSGKWAIGLGNALKFSNYDSSKALTLSGRLIGDQLVESIQKLTEPPLSPYTIVKKGGRTKPLIDTAVMIRSVDSELEEP